MKRISVLIVVLALLCSLTSYAEEAKAPDVADVLEGGEKAAATGTAAAEEKPPAPPETAPKLDLKTFAAKLSYTMGLEIGGYLRAMHADIDLTAFYRGVEDSINERTPLLTPQETAKITQEQAKRMREKFEAERKAMSEKNRKEGEAFLAENKKKEGVVTTDSGLQYLVLQEGDGPNPKATDEVKVHYRGTVLDGTEFDSSYKRGEPISFRLNGVIAGWTEGLQLMKVGSKHRLFIPSDLAYGPEAQGPIIQPDSTLIFEVELLGIEK